MTPLAEEKSADIDFRNCLGVFLYKGRVFNTSTWDFMNMVLQICRPRGCKMALKHDVAGSTCSCLFLTALTAPQRRLQGRVLPSFDYVFPCSLAENLRDESA